MFLIMFILYKFKELQLGQGNILSNDFMLKRDWNKECLFPSTCLVVTVSHRYLKNTLSSYGSCRMSTPRFCSISSKRTAKTLAGTPRAFVSLNTLIGLVVSMGMEHLAMQLYIGCVSRACEHAMDPLGAGFSNCATIAQNFDTDASERGCGGGLLQRR